MFISRRRKRFAEIGKLTVDNGCAGVYNNIAVCDGNIFREAYVMEKVSAGMKIRLVKDLDGSTPLGSTATVVYVDEFGQIFADWTEGGQCRITKEQFAKNFEIAA